MQFSIKPERLNEEIADFQAINNKMKKMQGDINAVRCNLNGTSDSYESISNALFKQNDAINALLSKLATMENGLEKAVALYLKCEESILNSDDYVEVEPTGICYYDASSDNESELDFFADLWSDIYDLFTSGVWDNPEKAQRVRNDNAMAEQIKELIEKDEYCESKWEKASVEEREEMLQDLFIEMQSIYGVSVDELVTKDLSARNANGLHYIAEDEDYEMIFIEEELLSEDFYYRKAIRTLSHEMRHAYQHEVVSDPERFKVDDATVKEWKENQADYKTVEEDGKKAYENQPVEKDAVDFEDKVIYWLFE